MENCSKITETFSGLNIFMTGATGFLGKVLVEKLIRSCPKIDKIYLLLRAKKGKSAKDRLREITDLPMFENLKKIQPDFVQEKLRVIEGDIAEPSLGLKEDDKKLLIDRIDIVYHNGASVRFDDPLKQAIFTNTRSAREVATLAKQMKHLKALVHVSTAYCNVDQKTVKEQLYPPYGDWKSSIEIAETIDSFTLDTLTSKYIRPHPNTYTFTKSLAEHVVYDLCQNEIPAVILRPTVVVNSMEEPIPGWIDNFNGPVGMLVACGKGIMRNSYGGKTVKINYIPVDDVVKGLILATFEKLNTRDLNVKFYNSSGQNSFNLSTKDLLDHSKQLKWEVPMKDIIWYPEGNPIETKFFYHLDIFLTHLLPAVMIDLILKISGKNPMLVRLQRKMFIVMVSMNYFLRHEWTFVSENFLNLQKIIDKNDLVDFEFKSPTGNMAVFIRDAMLGSRKFLLKDLKPNEDMEKDKIWLHKLYWTYVVANLAMYACLFWFTVSKIGPNLYNLLM